MKDNTAVINHAPRTVKTPFYLSKIIAIYAAGMAGPICLVGAFVGLEVLVVGLIHAVIALVLFLSLRGVLQRRQWARWVLVVLSALVALVLLFAIGQSLMAGGADIVGMGFFVVVCVVFAVIALCLSTRSARVWFTESGLHSDSA